MTVVLAHASALQALQHLAARGEKPRPVSVSGAYGTLKAPSLSEIAGIDRAVLGIGKRIHIAVPSREAAIRRSGVASHVLARPLPRWALLCVDPGLLCLHPIIAAAQMAQRLDLVERISLLYEICGTYATSAGGRNSYAEVKPLASVRTLTRARERLPELRGGALVADALRFATDGAASPAETEMALRFGLPRRLGGYAFGVPVLNREIRAGSFRYADGTPARKGQPRKPDLTWPELSIALDYHGERSHQTFKQVDRDLRRTNELQISGITCFTLTRHQASDCLATDRLAYQMQKAAFGRIRRYPPGFYAARLDLAARLLQIRQRNWQRLA